MVGMVEAKNRVISIPVILSETNHTGIKGFRENYAQTPHPGNMTPPPGRSYLSTFPGTLSKKSCQLSKRR